tara:strand:+ start:47 stop:283 length:237 start_codon:yes stop_codon:yes gene_type:complete
MRYKKVIRAGILISLRMSRKIKKTAISGPNKIHSRNLFFKICNRSFFEALYLIIPECNPPSSKRSKKLNIMRGKRITP